MRTTQLVLLCNCSLLIVSYSFLSTFSFSIIFYNLILHLDYKNNGGGKISQWINRVIYTVLTSHSLDREYRPVSCRQESHNDKSLWNIYDSRWKNNSHVQFVTAEYSLLSQLKIWYISVTTVNSKKTWQGCWLHCAYFQTRKKISHWNHAVNCPAKRENSRLSVQTQSNATP
jgi:hypothetical protein